MKSYRLYQIDAFTTEMFRGNPAGVVTNAEGLNEAQMQRIARELNNSETAFIFPPTSPGHDVHVRFFTPSVEVPSCGHATVAAHYARAKEMQLPACTVVQKIGAGILPVEIVLQEDDYSIVMTQGAIEFDDSLSAQTRLDIVSALGLSPKQLDDRCPIEIVSTGHSKVLIAIRDRETLNQITPDLARLAQLSRQTGCNGYFVFVLEPNSSPVLSHGRMFAPAIGINEDPVTGNANGPLGAYLVKHRVVPVHGSSLSFRGQQGEAMGRVGVVDVTVEIENGMPKKVKVAGRAVMVFKSELSLA